MHIISFVLSYGNEVKEPCFPDETEYNEIVKCDYCNIESWPDEELLRIFMWLLKGMFPEDTELDGSVVRSGCCKVVIPKGAIRRFLESKIAGLKKEVEKITPDKYRFAAHDILKFVDYVDAFDTVFVEISDGGFMDYDTVTRSLAMNLEDNDEKDTVVYVYGAINHHI